MCARQIAGLISLIALILCQSPISMNHSKYSTAVKWGNMSVFVPPNVDVAIEKGERLVLLSGIGIHEIIADKLCVNITILDGSLLPLDVEIATGRQLSIGYRMAAHNVTDQVLEDNRGRMSLDVKNVYDESGRCNMHIKSLVDVSLQDNFLVLDIANISYEFGNATAKHSMPTTESPGLHAPTMRRKNTIFVPPNVDLAIERGQRLMLLSGFDANDSLAYMLCVNISIPGQEAKIVGCVFDSPDYGINNGKNYSLEQVNGAWALNISSAMTKINRTTYSWWLKTDPSRSIAETLISIHDVSVSPWYVKTRAGKRVSVCYGMQERNAIDISLTDNRGRHVFDFVNSDGEGTNFNFHLTTNINVSLHNNLMVIDLANVSCQNHGYYKLAITTQSSVTNIGLHLYVIENITVNITLVKASQSFMDFAILRCTTDANHHFDLRDIKWFKNTQEIQTKQGTTELNITNFQPSDVLSCQIQTSCRNYSSQKISAYVNVETNSSYIEEEEGSCKCSCDEICHKSNVAISTTHETSTNTGFDETPTENDIFIDRDGTGSRWMYSTIACCSIIGVMTIIILGMAIKIKRQCLEIRRIQTGKQQELNGKGKIISGHRKHTFKTDSNAKSSHQETEL